MTVKEPSAEQRKSLEAYLRHPEKSLFAARCRLDGLSDLVDKGELPLTFLAFEVLEKISASQQLGFAAEQYQKVVPDRFSSATVEVPVFLLDVLLDCWHDFSRSDPTKGSLDRSFGNAAKGRRKRPFLHKWQNLDNERFYAFCVLEFRLERFFKGNPVSLTEAFEQVAVDEGVSSSTTKNAWQKHRAFLEGVLRPLHIQLSDLDKN